MTLHMLKILPVYYRGIKEGIKTFEVRKNDRDYQVGDVLVLRAVDEKNPSEYLEGEEWEPLEIQVSYVLTDHEFPGGIKDGYAVLGLHPRLGGSEQRRVTIEHCSDHSEATRPARFTEMLLEYARELERAADEVGVELPRDELRYCPECGQDLTRHDAGGSCPCTRCGHSPCECDQIEQGGCICGER